MKENFIRRVSVLLAIMVIFVMSVSAAGTFAAENVLKDSKGKVSAKAASAGNAEAKGKEMKASAEIKTEVKSEDDTEVELEAGLDTEAGTEAETGVEDSEGTDKVENLLNKSTQVHLHLNKCVGPVEAAFVEMNGEWYEMTNPGNSPLFKIFDDGEYVKDDVTAFKLVFSGGQEMVVDISEIKVGVEAEGTINYWLEECEAEEEKDLPLHVQLKIDHSKGKIDHASLVMANEAKTEFKLLNNLFTIELSQDTKLEHLHGIEITSNGETKLVLLKNLPENLLSLNEGVLEIQLNWEVAGTSLDNTEGNESKDTSNDSSDALPADSSNGGSGNVSGGSTVDGTHGWSGDALPQTGEESRMMFYVLGLLISAAGLLLFKNPLKN